MPDTNSLDDDLEAIKAMAEVLEETGLTEIELDRGGVRLRIAKTGTTVAMQAAAPMVAAPQPALAQGQESAGGAADLSGHPGAVTSPMVGTAYLAPAPTSPPFVSVGDQVSEGQTVLIVEAMKTMNEIKATKAGKITQILAKDAEPVEFGEVLLIIE